LLGVKALAEGVLPTTNEITVLRYGDPEAPESERQQASDGFVERLVEAELLRELNVWTLLAPMSSWSGSSGSLRSTSRVQTSCSS
jgi:hypothetical protein